MIHTLFFVREAALVLTSLVGDETVFAPSGSQGCMAVARELDKGPLDAGACQVGQEYQPKATFVMHFYDRHICDIQLNNKHTLCKK